MGKRGIGGMFAAGVWMGIWVMAGGFVGCTPGGGDPGNGGPGAENGGSDLPELNQADPQVKKGPQLSSEMPANAAEYNQAGCDPPANVFTCTPSGKCCDTHDACIDQHCAPACRVANACLQPNRFFDPGVPGCRVGEANYNAACCACHAAASNCIGNCNQNPNAPGCGESECCDAGNCGCEEQCYDAANNKPIYDPCVCENLNLPHARTCYPACNQYGFKGCGREFEGCADDCPCAAGFCCDNYTCLPCPTTAAAGVGGGAGMGGSNGATGGMGGTGMGGTNGATGGMGGSGMGGTNGVTGGMGGFGGSNTTGSTGGMGGAPGSTSTVATTSGGGYGGYGSGGYGATTGYGGWGGN